MGLIPEDPAPSAGNVTTLPTSAYAPPRAVGRPLGEKSRGFRVVSPGDAERRPSAVDGIAEYKDVGEELAIIPNKLGAVVKFEALAETAGGWR
jgi:hypothetical protein